MPPSLAKNWGMPNKDRSFHESPQKAGGEGWLYSEQQQQLCHFKPDTATVHAQWVAIRTYSYVPPRPPEPMTRRRMLRHNAIEAWQTMQKTGWRRCPPPVRWRLPSKPFSRSSSCKGPPLSLILLRV